MTNQCSSTIFLFFKDNGNCIFDDTIVIPELTEVCYEFDVPQAISDLKELSYEML